MPPSKNAPIGNGKEALSIVGATRNPTVAESMAMIGLGLYMVKNHVDVSPQI